MSISRVLELLESAVRAILQALVALLFMVMVSLVSAQVFTRFLTTHSLTWSEELSRFTMIWLIYLASILVYADNAHIAVDALVIQLKGKLAKAVQVANRVFVLVFVCMVIAGAVKFMPTVAIQEAPATGIIMSHIYIAIPLSMAFVGIISARQIIRIAVGWSETADAKGGGA